MKHHVSFSGMFLSALFLCLPVPATAASAENGSFMNSVTEEGQCGHEGAGKLQFLSNSDQASGYEVTLRATVMHEGKSSETLETHTIKAGGKKYLGCSFSDIMPLTSNSWEIDSETKSH
jgi:hypothetical protein